MSAILYGNLSAEVVSGLGTRIDRLTLRRAVTDLLWPQHPAAPPKPLMLGREREAAEALGAIEAGLPVGFHAPCGYGKTTLLRYVVASASERGAAPSCVYLQAGNDRVEDLLQQLVTRLYTCDQPVKLTPGQCAQLLGQVNAVIAVDDLSAGPEKAGYLLDVLGRCRVVIGSARPVLGRRGTSVDLPGLPDDPALALVAGDLGRPLTSQESTAVRRLTAAVDGQPLHLRQAAALVRDGRHSFESLARHAEGGPEVLDLLSISALAGRQRRALAVLAFAAGALLPADLVAALGQLADLAECLPSLHRRGLAVQHDDRFGLPFCQAASYRQALLQDLDLGAAARELAAWLAAADPGTAQSLSAADAALAILEFAAERGDWTTVARLARAAEEVLFIAGRWEAWQHDLAQGLDAAKAGADRAAEAFFSHQLGSLAFCQDRLDDARRLLQHALVLREQAGDRDGADLTRHNLRLLEPSAPPPRPRPRAGRRRILLTLASLASALALVTGTVAIAGTMRGGPGQPTGPASSTGPHIGNSGSGTGPGSGSSSGTGPGSGSSSGTGPGSGSSSSTGPGSGSASGSGSGSGSSTSSALVIVPDVTGQTQLAATSTLQAQELTASPATTTACGPGSNGTVVSQNPLAGQSVRAGSAVGIAVCNATVVVLSVLGQNQNQATTTLQDQGLTVSTTSSSSCGPGADGSVVSEQPVAGTSVLAGSAVIIGVCVATG